ncbi:hypothetical protein DMB92_07815 [Campylobacter sp. MIT 99-7217]|uniref:DUF945 family protein n=1 Tax=Campylobacter sp. MIT 99-7217 TaxID=535091 RepID=UPI001159244E|nr:DUF945 family protein [Campylobacter sp. MIT 99-7217]TQR30357.1 hypothetical protein DMB92_07815 [Campylobacter sp. MIT 99-7217]
MKKIIAAVCIVAFVVLAYLGQVFYMGNLHEKNFNDFVQKLQTWKYAKIEDVVFEKGFFNSKASFKLASQENDFMVNVAFLITADFKNSIFTQDVIEGQINLTEPFLSLVGDILPNGSVARFSVNSHLNSDFDIKFIFSDIDVQRAEGTLLLKNFVLNFTMTNQGSILFSDMNIDEFRFEDFNPFMGRVSVKLEKVYSDFSSKEGINLKDYLSKVSDSQTKFSIYRLSMNDVVLDELNLEDIVQTEGNVSFNESVKLYIKEVNLGQLSPDQRTLQDIKLDFVAQSLNQVLYSFDYDPVDILEDKLFLSTNPKLKLQDFSFSRAGAKFSSKGEANFSADEEVNANFSAKSDVLPSQILPILALFGADELFEKKDDIYVLDLNATGSVKKPTTMINGTLLEIDDTYELQDEFSNPPSDLILD